MNLKRLVSMVVCAAFLLGTILGGSAVTPQYGVQAAKMAPLSAAQKDAYLRDRAIYLECLESGAWRELLESEDTPLSYLEYYDISATTMFDLDGNGVFELLFEAYVEGGVRPEGVSGMFSIMDGEVITLLSAAESGGSIGGDRLLFHYDTKTNKDVVEHSAYAGGFGGYSSYGLFLDYSGGEFSMLMSYEVLTMFNDLEETVKEFAALYDNYYVTREDGDISEVTVYLIDDQDVMEEDYAEAFDRFDRLDAETRIQLTDVGDKGLLPIPQIFADGGEGSGSSITSRLKPPQTPTTPELPTTPATTVPDPVVRSNTNSAAALFTDIGGHWARNDIEDLTINGFVNGVTDTAYEPEANITREQLMKMVVTTMGKYWGGSYWGEEMPYADIRATDWSYIYIRDAIDAGIIFEGGVFHPQALADRETCALWISRALELEASYTGGQFADHNKISYQEEVTAVSEAGLIKGYEDNTFRPQNNLTRAEAAALLNRAYNYMLAHQTDGMDFAEIDRLTGDFNGDGRNETAILYADVDREQDDNWFNGFYYVEVNGKRSPVMWGEAAYLTLSRADLDTRDAYVELAHSSEGPSADFLTTFYRYTGDNLYYIGNAPSILNPVEDSYSREIDGVIALHGDGSLDCTMRRYYIQSWEMPAEFYLNNKGRLVWREHDTYPMEERKVTVLENIRPSGKAGHPEISVNKGETVTFVATDFDQWFMVRKSSGEEGWINLNGLEIYEFADRYFDGVVVYD